MERLLNTREAATLLGVQPKTLHQKRSSGGGPAFIRVGGAIRYHPRDLEEYVRRRRRTSTSDDGSTAAA